MIQWLTVNVVKTEFRRHMRYFAFKWREIPSTEHRSRKECLAAAIYWRDKSHECEKGHK